MQRILIANCDQAECKLIEEALDNKHVVLTLRDPSEYQVSEHDCDAILVDSNFTENHGFDFLMNILVDCHVPTLLIVPIDHPEYALEAVRAGAYNYLVKTPNYLELLSFTIEKAIAGYLEHDELLRTIMVLKKRVKELESKTSLASNKNPIAQSVDQRETSSPSANNRTSLIDEIKRQLSEGKFNLPSYPEINDKLKTLIDKGAGMPEISRLISDDAAISTELIKISNSALFKGVSNNISVEQAINRLGLKETAMHTEIISNRALYSNSSKKFSPLLADLWNHSMACAHTSHIVSTHLGIGEPHDLFMMGLLHDIGVLLLLQIIIEVDSLGAMEQEIVPEQLHDFLTTHHNSFGKSILTRWKFPESYTDIAAFHDNPENSDNQTDELMIVNFSNLLVHTLGHALKPEQGIELEKLESTKHLGLDVDKIEAITEEAIVLIDEARQRVN